MQDLKVLKKRFRPEIEGVRTIATLLIAIYHIWLGRVSGGIDVFFVISGFLITTSLISKVERNGKVGYITYIVNLAKRLFPQALFVSFITAILSIFIIPKVQWETLISHIFASTFYFENWHLALESVDYLAQDNSPSPFQHFWSLSVQGQFYIIWPFIIFATFKLAKVIFKTPVRKTLLTVLGIIFVTSISYSIYKTNTNQPWAYFDTFARAWEFSVGGIFALLIPYLKMNKWVSTVAGWFGIAIICLTGIVLQVSTVFPGYMALVPISGALFVLIAAENGTRFSAERFLSNKILVFLGGLTYGIYLWHWPLLIFYKQYFNVTEVPVLHGVIILMITICLAYISTNYIEKPIRTLKVQEAKATLTFALSALVVVVVAVALGMSYYVTTQKTQVVAASVDDYPGARVFYENVKPTEGVELIPSLLTLKEDVPEFYSMSNCLAQNLTEVRICHFGVTENPDYTIAVVGGSHSGHWMPALEILAEEMNFQIDLYSHDGCRFTDEDPDDHLTENCIPWNANLIKVLQDNPPDLVFVQGTLNKRDYVPQGFVNQWKRLEGYTTVFAIRDNPRMNEKTPECLERVDDISECSVPRDEALSKVKPWDNTEGIPDNVYFADLSDYFCDDTTCPAIAGNIIVYRDDNHITTAYMKTLTPVLKPYLQEALEQLE